MPPRTRQDLEFEVSELRRELDDLKTEIALYRVNGLAELASGHGFQEFGGGTVRLDSNGIQIVDTDDNDKGRIWFVEDFSLDPSAEVDHGRIESWITSSVTGIRIKSINATNYVAGLRLTSQATGGVFIQSELEGYGAGGSTTSARVLVFYDDTKRWVKFRGVLHLEDEEDLTISGGVVTPDGWASRINIDTEAAAATDDVDTIAETNYTDGAVIIVRAADSARTVVLKHGTGNLLLNASSDRTLNNSADVLGLILLDSNWHEFTFANNGA